MQRHDALVAVVAAFVTSSAAAVGGPGGGYFHFQNISSAGDFEAGHMRGNPGHWVGRYEEQGGTSNTGNVRWAGGGSSGLRVWDLNHAEEEAEEGPPEARAPDRKSGAGTHASTDCFLRRLQRRSIKTLITRDCSGNPLAPPGVQVSPGPPRTPPRPRARPPPPLPPWWLPAEQTQPPPPPLTTDVYLQKRGSAFEPPRGFQPTGAAVGGDQEGQEDHLSGMTYADKQLMFGDGSYQPASARGQIVRIVKGPVKIVAPAAAMVQGLAPMKGAVPLKVPMKGLPLKGLSGMPLAVKVSAMKGGLRPWSRPVVARLRPMVVLVRPMSSNKMPMGGSGPVNAAPPVPIREWIKNMWAG